MAERLNKDSFQEKVLNASGLAIADFYSDSCIPCKKLSTERGIVLLMLTFY